MERTYKFNRDQKHRMTVEELYGNTKDFMVFDNVFEAIEFLVSKLGTEEERKEAKTFLDAIKL